MQTPIAWYAKLWFYTRKSNTLLSSLQNNLVSHLFIHMWLCRSFVSRISREDPTLAAVQKKRLMHKAANHDSGHFKGKFSAAFLLVTITVCEYLIIPKCSRKMVPLRKANILCFLSIGDYFFSYLNQNKMYRHCEVS